MLRFFVCVFCAWALFLVARDLRRNYSIKVITPGSYVKKRPK